LSVYQAAESLASEAAVGQSLVLAVVAASPVLVVAALTSVLVVVVPTPEQAEVQQGEEVNAVPLLSQAAVQEELKSVEELVLE